MKKYFFFDIDGTLTNKQTGELIPSAKTTIKKLFKIYYNRINSNNNLISYTRLRY